MPNNGAIMFWATLYIAAASVVSPATAATDSVAHASLVGATARIPSPTALATSRQRNVSSQEKRGEGDALAVSVMGAGAGLNRGNTARPIRIVVSSRNHQDYVSFPEGRNDSSVGSIKHSRLPLSSSVSRSVRALLPSWQKREQGKKERQFVSLFFDSISSSIEESRYSGNSLSAPVSLAQSFAGEGSSLAGEIEAVVAFSREAVAFQMRRAPALFSRTSSPCRTGAADPVRSFSSGRGFSGLNLAGLSTDSLSSFPNKGTRSSIPVLEGSIFLSLDKGSERKSVALSSLVQSGQSQLPTVCSPSGSGSDRKSAGGVLYVLYEKEEQVSAGIDSANALCCAITPHRPSLTGFSLLSSSL